ncbi:MAG: hypothetical protein GF329_00105 [Candidatus Lokiarchaeota archaeon]|nr:hypothetical protein [Candidatus Lokiarchaeota archaeon]
MDFFQSVFWTLLFVVIFWVCINGIVKLFKIQKKGLEVGPVYLIAKTSKLNNLIDRIARKFPRFWKVIFYIGIGFGYLGMGVVMYFLAVNLFQLLTNPQPANAVVPLIPGITVTGQPLLYFLIGVAVIAVTHEFAHGVAARLESIKLKSVGVMVLLFLFGAFVEIDEYSMSKRSRLGRLSVYAAGSFSNFVIGFFSFLIVTSMYSNVPAGVEVVDSIENSPAYGKIGANDVIIEVNGVTISSSEDFDREIAKIRPLQVANLTVLDLETNTYRNILINTGFNPSYASLGPSRCRFQPEEDLINIISGTNTTERDINRIKEIDNLFLNFSSSANLLNFTFSLNISKYSEVLDGEINKIIVNISGIFNNSSNNVSIYLINHTNTQNNVLLKNKNNTRVINHKYLNISSSSPNLSSLILQNSIIECMIVVNNTQNFNLALNEFSFYVITNETNGWFGIYSFDYLPAAGVGQFLYRSLNQRENPLFQTFFYIWLLSWGIAFMNVLPFPFFDGDKLIVDLIAKPGEFYPVLPPEEEKNNRDNDYDEEKEESSNGNSENPKNRKEQKTPWTYKHTIIWIIRGIAIFLLVANIALSIYWMIITGNYNIFEFLF